MAMKPNEFKDKLKGVVHLVLTPFDKNDQVDVQALKQGIRNVVDKCRGEDVVILTLGSTAEFYAMTEAENRLVAETVIDEVNGVFPVMIGSARAGTKLTIEESKFAEKAGADALLIVHPYYFTPIEEELIKHYEAVAGAVNIGICIYNNPATSKMWVGPDTLKKLSKVDNIVGLKENTDNMMVFLKILQTLDKKDISIFAGLGHSVYQFLCLYGLTGYVTELLNFAPHLGIGLYKAGQQKDLAEIRKNIDTIELIWDYMARVASRRTRIPSILTPAQTSNMMPFYQTVFKAATELTGTPCGKVRAPMCNLTDTEIAELKGVLKQMGCKVV
jgi:4-hydroxy-tetrahydrodipicolinate synthase